jgi:hypothetical protein
VDQMKYQQKWLNMEPRIYMNFLEDRLKNEKNKENVLED